ncbi:MAG: AmmeMemoRadiSam system protein B, partial [Candidatus Micrarchaeota archaeon]
VLEENLKDAFLVVSTDLSHYHDYETAKKLDAKTIEGVLKLDLKTVAEGEECGKMPLLAAIRLAQLKKWKPILLDARNSGDTAGDKQQVVGYASFAFV